MALGHCEKVPSWYRTEQLPVPGDRIGSKPASQHMPTLDIGQYQPPNISRNNSRLVTAHLSGFLWFLQVLRLDQNLITVRSKPAPGWQIRMWRFVSFYVYSCIVFFPSAPHQQDIPRRSNFQSIITALNPYHVSDIFHLNCMSCSMAITHPGLRAAPKAPMSLIALIARFGVAIVPQVAWHGAPDSLKSSNPMNTEKKVRNKLSWQSISSN